MTSSYEDADRWDFVETEFQQDCREVAAVEARAAGVQGIREGCWSCGLKGHISRLCPTKKCNICHKMGHSSVVCPSNTNVMGGSKGDNRGKGRQSRDQSKGSKGSGKGGQKGGRGRGKGQQPATEQPPTPPSPPAPQAQGGAATQATQGASQPTQAVRSTSTRNL